MAREQKLKGHLMTIEKRIKLQELQMSTMDQYLDFLVARKLELDSLVVKKKDRGEIGTSQVAPWHNGQVDGYLVKEEVEASGKDEEVEVLGGVFCLVNK